MRAIDLEALKIFRTVVDEGGVVRAAHKRNRVQSNVTTRIRQLEDHVGARLFRREGLREAEIQHLHFAFGCDFYICGLQVPVNDSFVVGLLQCLANLRTDLERLFQRKRPVLFQSLLECFPWYELHH